MSYGPGELSIVEPALTAGYDRPYDVGRDQFGVFLPHSCDEWIIGVGTKDECLTALRDLIRDAQAALASLETSNNAANP